MELNFDVNAFVEASLEQYFQAKIEYTLPGRLPISKHGRQLEEFKVTSTFVDAAQLAKDIFDQVSEKLRGNYDPRFGIIFHLRSIQTHYLEDRFFVSFHFAFETGIKENEPQQTNEVIEIGDVQTLHELRLKFSPEELIVSLYETVSIPITKVEALPENLIPREVSFGWNSLTQLVTEINRQVYGLANSSEMMPQIFYTSVENTFADGAQRNCTTLKYAIQYAKF